MNAQQTSKVFGCSPEQAQAQMERNLAQLRRMHGKAVATGKKVNGYTADMLQSMIDKTRKGWNL